MNADSNPLTRLWGLRRASRGFDITDTSAPRFQAMQRDRSTLRQLRTARRFLTSASECQGVSIVTTSTQGVRCKSVQSLCAEVLRDTEAEKEEIGQETCESTL